MIDLLILIVLSSLAVWRLTHMVQREDGPWRVFERIRSRYIEYKYPIPVAKGMIGELLACHYCGSVWVAMPFGLLVAYANLHTEGGAIIATFMGVLAWLCSSSGSIFLELKRRQMDE